MSEKKNNISKSLPVQNNDTNELLDMNGQLAHIIKRGDCIGLESLRMSSLNSSLKPPTHSNACDDDLELFNKVPLVL